MLSVWGVWVVRAVPPPTCAHVGSVGALDTPKLCPVGLEPPHMRSEGTPDAVDFWKNESINGGSSSSETRKITIEWRKIVQCEERHISLLLDGSENKRAENEKHTA